MEHEYYSGLSLALMVYIAAKKGGPQIAAWLDKEVDVSSLILFIFVCNTQLRPKISRRSPEDLEFPVFRIKRHSLPPDLRF